MSVPVVPDRETDPAGYLLAACEIRERRAKAANGGNLAIDHGYVVERVDGCTCGAGGEFPHEPHCGWGPAWPLKGPLGEHVAAEANPVHALAGVALWRGIAERHGPITVVRTVYCRADHSPRVRYPCPDLLDAVEAARAYLDGTAG